MLKVTVKSDETWDDVKEEFIPAFPPYELTLEHSLISLSKWESKWHKPYLSTELSMEEAKDYVRCMCLKPNVPDEVFEHVGNEVLQQVADYIADPMTATWITEDKFKKPGRPNARHNGQIVTSELVYSWMINAGIPWECEKWHFNRLMMLIRVVGEQNKPAKKMSKNEITNRYAQLNAARKAKYHTRG